jgi:hypothetical protein
VNNRPRPVLGIVGISAVPAAVTTSSWIAAQLVFNSSVVAWTAASFAGVLSLLAFLVASAELQETIRVWICHRPENRIAAAEAFAIRRRIRKATCGGCWTATRAGRVRSAAVACEHPHADLAEVMRITRLPLDASGQAEQTDLDPCPSPARRRRRRRTENLEAEESAHATALRKAART